MRFRFALATALALFPTIAVSQPVPVAVSAADTPWLYRNSDIPPDPAWTFGVLPNGLRYAVRNNGVPAGQVSIRVLIDAGTLMEGPTERGFAHFNEHMAFRGSATAADGEAKRIWQRLGATFGQDTNATTSPTQTVYKLDLPAATPESIDESLRILYGMMAKPSILPGAVASEKRTILNEIRERASPGQRIGAEVRGGLYWGQPLGRDDDGAEAASVAAATPSALRAFQERWYRPNNAVVVVVGDVAPDVAAELIKRNFAAWTPPAVPAGRADFGKPSAAAPRARVSVQPGAPPNIVLAVMRPWQVKADTVEYNRDKQMLELAANLISRRLESRARAGAAFLSAEVQYTDVLRSANVTVVQVTPTRNDWRAAIREVRGVIADALSRPPSDAEIAREVGEYRDQLDQAVETETSRISSELSDNLVGAVDIRETVASASVARDVFTNMGARITPQALLAATKRIFAGTPMRAVLTLPVADPGGQAALLTELTRPVLPIRVDSAKPASIDDLPKFGAPATSGERTPLAPPLPLERVTLSNGATLLLWPNKAEANTVYVQARWGDGRAGLPVDAPNHAWAADFAITASGIGNLGLDEIERIALGRRFGLDFQILDDSFGLRATTRAADLKDQLAIIAGKLGAPRWDLPPVLRAQAATLAGFAAADGSAMAVVNRRLTGWLRGDDRRWAPPSRAEVAALTPEAFRTTWAPRLAEGPVELAIFGDFVPEAAIAAAEATIGTLPPREAVTRAGPPPLAFPSGRTLQLTHRGPRNSAGAVLAWPLGGGRAELYEARVLDVLANVFNDRMFDALREADGESYSPSVGANWPLDLPSGGSFVVLSQTRPEGVAKFYDVASAIARDLATNGPNADELQRALTPMRLLVDRTSGNPNMIVQLAGASRDPARARQVLSLPSDLQRVTAADVQAAAARWLVAEKAARMTVLPAVTSPAGARAARRR